MEYVDIVNDKDEVIGQITRKGMYDNKLTHRIVHILIIDPSTKEVYFQKRSDKVEYLPGYYCTSAGGHVLTGETYEEAAKRELNEELGLTIPIKKVADLQFALNGHNRFIQLFLASAETGFNFKDGEVVSGEFLNMEKANDLIKKGEKIHPQLEVCFNWLYNNKELF